MVFYARQLKTSRERPKSAPYLRLNRTRKPLFLQLETTKALKKLKIEEKIFPSFFSNFFEVSDKSHSAEKCKRGNTLGFFEHPFCCKISIKIYGGTLWSNKKIRKRMRNLNSLTVPKKGESFIVSKKVEKGTLLLWNGLLEALDALKIKY